MNLYILNVKDIDYNIVADKYNQSLLYKESDKNNKKFNKFHLLGRLLLYQALKKDFNLNIKEIEIKKNKYGKPYLSNHKLYFSISYSNDWVICCISKYQVGIDIEKIQDIDKELLKYISKKSTLWIDRHSQSQLNNYFFSDWCLKESFVKYLGMGLSYDIKKLNFEIQDSITLSIENKEINNLYFKVLDIIHGYKIAICMNQNKKIKISYCKKENIYNMK